MKLTEVMQHIEKGSRMFYRKDIDRWYLKLNEQEFVTKIGKRTIVALKERYTFTEVPNNLSDWGVIYYTLTIKKE